MFEQIINEEIAGDDVDNIEGLKQGLQKQTVIDLVREINEVHRKNTFESSDYFNGV